MKIIFWGTPKYAAENLKHILNAGHNVIGVVTQPDKKRSRGKRLSPSPDKIARINILNTRKIAPLLKILK